MSRKSKKKEQLARQAQSPYELHRSLPNPMFEGAPQRRRQPMFDVPPPPKPKRKWRRRILTTFIVLFLIFGSIGGYLGWKFVQNEVRIFGWKGLWSLLFPGKLKGEDRGHVNILLVGNSADDPGHPGSQLTDSLMLISINTEDHTGFMLSIPRDLYVNIPNNGYAKINETYQDGQQEKFDSPSYPKGGMGLLEEVVSQKLGVDIDYYALVNYSALRDAVNAVGGVDVNINSIDSRGLYDPNISPVDGGPLKLTNGKHTLNGQTALNLARARGDSYYSYGFPRADFDRTEHQRMLLTALKEKSTSLGVLANPFRMASLFDATGKNVKTDMSLGNVRRLYGITKKIPNNKILSASLNDATVGSEKHVNLLQSYATASGQSALVPAAGIDDYTDIDEYVDQLIAR